MKQERLSFSKGHSMCPRTIKVRDEIVVEKPKLYGWASRYAD